MKKLLSLIIIFVLLWIIASPVDAYEFGIVKPESFVVVRIDTNSEYTINGWYANMIKNPYYKKNYNSLLAHSYAVYKNSWQQENNKEYIQVYVDECMGYPLNYVTLILEENTNPKMTVYEYNKKVLQKYFDDDNIVYISDNDFAAIVGVEDVYADVVTQMEELEFIGDAFFSDDIQDEVSMPGIYALGDVVAPTQSKGGDDAIKPNAADARFLLRYAAALEKGEMSKQFYFCGDVNFDGKISAKDARTVLRMAAGLEQIYYLSFSDYKSWER